MDYRRSHQPGGTFFFTVVTYQRRPFLCQPLARRLLREAFRRCRIRWSFEVVAIVLLPDHPHCIWTLPKNDSDYSKRWAWLKKHFTQTWMEMGGHNESVPLGKGLQRRRGVWQDKFWEHPCRDDQDLIRHVEYIHYNPVKHGLAKCPIDWLHSSFHRFVKAGIYPAYWCCQGDENRRQELTSRFELMTDTAGE